jgi:hypothetical protein
VSVLRGCTCQGQSGRAAGQPGQLCGAAGPAPGATHTTLLDSAQPRSPTPTPHRYERLEAQLAECYPNHPVSNLSPTPDELADMFTRAALPA